ncbi:hypothetical protein ATCC90586_004653 [Pythium insidiosum]|nr:hypothetical protein ATCC90586_004653 [Pythium insidiosum]
MATYTTQYGELLKFLKAYGAMLHDVLPEFLLSQELFVRACEDPRADPALFSSVALREMPFLPRRRALEHEWLAVSTDAWMKVLYQVIKCFLLFRVTPPKAPAGKPADASSAKPRACQGSNVYSEAEMTLLQWLCDHVRDAWASAQAQAQGAMTPAEALVLDLSRDLRDGRVLFHLLASHIPTLSPQTSEYACFRLEPLAAKRASSPPPELSAAQLQHNADTLLHAMRCFGVDCGLDARGFAAALGGRETVVLLLHLHQMLPQFIPKATIEFKGVLGQAMDKTIELRNPSNRVIRYQVFLDQQSSGTDADASGEFSIEAPHVVLEPGRPVGFVVSCRPRFSRKVTARLVFQSVRDAPAGASSSGATMVFLLESHIVSRRPVRVLEMETTTYERKALDVVIENQFLAHAHYKISMTQHEVATPASLAPPPDAGGAKLAKPPAGRKKDNAPAASAAAAVVPFAAASRRQTAAAVRREELSAEHAWCIVAQQPFFLPEHAGAGGDSAASTSSATGAAGGAGGVGVVSIRSQSSATVRVEFLPLVPGTYKCQLLFLDEKVGEFMYEIVATAHLPASLETLEFQCELGAAVGRQGGTQFLRELTVPPKNLPLAKALAVYVERASGLLKAKLKEGLKKCEETHHASFAVEVNSPFFAPVFSDMTLSYSTGASGARPAKQSTIAATGAADSAAGQDGEASASAAATATGKPDKATKTLARLLTPRTSTSAVATPNCVLLGFQPKSAGVYTCKVLLHSHNTSCGSSDWRVYDLVAKVKEPNVKTLLEFVAPARHCIVQEIPLANPSDAAWTLKAQFSAAKSSFSGPSSVHVPAKKTVSYPLTFSPRWILEEKASLTLTNPTTQQRFEFELSGYGEEPLAQDHVVLSCQARTSVTHAFDVVSFKTDPAGEQRFTVESDLRDVVGAPTVVVPAPGESVKYPLTFSPLVSGTYFGSITFTNAATGEYVWYTIEATVAPPAPEATLAMDTTVRSAVAVEVSLENPLDHAVEFQIELQGMGLLGPATLALQARAAGTYELVYAPLLETRDAEDGAVLFANAELGQFWYALRLRATPAAPTALDDMACAVGDVCTQPILLQNPSDQPLALQYRISNPRNFSIKGARAAAVAVPPFGLASVLLEYTPSSLRDFEAARVEFFMPGVVSDWAFDVRGKGVPPSVMKPIVVRSKVREAASALFTFKNPFADALRLDVQLLVRGRVVTRGRLGDAAPRSPRPDADANGDAGDGDDARDVEAAASMFDILLKKPRVSLEGFGHLQVPISFLPQFVCEAHAEIVLKGQGEYAELEWRYPIRGIAEAPLHPRAFTLPCQARESVEKTLRCELLAAPPGFDLASETLTPEWEIPVERFGALATAAAIERALSITPLPLDADGAALVVPFAVQFEPLRPYRGSVYLLLQRKKGGLWRFEVALDVSDPVVDDVLTIESTLNTTSSVTFQLRNQFREPAPFQAEFSAGSSSAFTVYPTQGVLPPFGSAEGASLVVSFTPTGYGKMQSGQLVIFTEEMQWTFNVKGAYPDLTSSLASKSLSSSASRSRLGMTPTDSLGSSKSSGSSKARGARR